jgi:transposase-like protein
MSLVELAKECLTVEKIYSKLKDLFKGAMQEMLEAELTEEVHRMIYTTNIIKGYHRLLRKVTKTKTDYPTDESLRKIIYLATMEAGKKWTMPVRNWVECIS